MKAFYRPKRSFGQGNIFTPVCHSFCSQGGVCAPDFALIFRGGAPDFALIWGGLFWGGFLQIFGGGSSRFWGGAPDFALIFRGGILGGGCSSKFSGGVFSTGIRSTFGRYASYWNAFLYSLFFRFLFVLCRSEKYNSTPN